MVGFGFRKYLTPGRYRLELTLLRSSDLFDAEYYLQQHPEVAASGKDPAIDYLEHGHDGRNPSMEFDAQFYLSTYSDVKASEANPLVHYLRFGKREGRRIKKVQNVHKLVEVLLQSPLFDEEYYVREYPDAATSDKSPASHYLEFGHEGRNPSPDFDAKFYLSSYPDVQAKKENPLIHYLQHGKQEGRKIRPLASATGNSSGQGISEEEKELINLLRQSRLFDEKYYVQNYPDAASSGKTPVAHYLEFGHEGRNPSAEFDARFYISNYPDIRYAKENPLVHYLRFGEREGRQIKSVKIESEQEQIELLKQSSLFNPDYYTERYPDVAESGLGPYTHYLRHGAQGRHPSADFDAKFYLSKYSDVRTKRLNPLIHYLRHGKQEDRQIRPVTTAIPALRSHSPADWDRLASDYRAKPKAAATVDLIIPVYKGFEETANCLFSVVESRLQAEIGCEIIAVNDATPDDKLSTLLDDLAAKGLITLVRNPTNMGFVESVNAGMRQHDDRDVILLNSDTEVYGDWVERLRNAVYLHSNIGTATPFSNNATICSYPHFPNDFDGAFEVPFAEIDRLTSEANRGKVVDIPTAVGFCMYIRRECLREVGLFDAQAFGRGYGEENDFCRRIAAREWRNILAADIFVRHLGGVSFSDTATALQQNAIKVIRQRYPDYDRLIQEFIARDPIKPLRRNLDLARLARARGKGFFLFILHNRGGGTQRHVSDLYALLNAEGFGTLTLTNASADGTIATILCPDVPNLSNGMQFDVKHGLTSATNLMRALGVVHIHVHHLIDFSEEMGPLIQRLAAACGIAYDITPHDYFLACPRVHMIGIAGRYCENSDVNVCEQCVASLGTPVGDVAAWLWRENNAKLLANARKIFVPDIDVAERLTRFFPGISPTVRKHPETRPDEIEEPVQRQLHETLRVAVIGAINKEKGSDVIADCLDDIQRRQLPIKIVLFGTIDNSEIRSSPHIQVLGRYVDDELQAILKRSRCHQAFFPSICPETYSYTLSHAHYAGLYPIAFDLGATASRIKASGWGTVLPLDFATMPAKINDALLALRPGGRPAVSPADSVSYKSVVNDYYGLDPIELVGARGNSMPVVQPMRPGVEFGNVAPSGPEAAA